MVMMQGTLCVVIKHTIVCGRKCTKQFIIVAVRIAAVQNKLRSRVSNVKENRHQADRQNNLQV